MDSLLANYASSDDDADETLPTPAPAATGRGEAGARPSAPSGGIFSKLPQPKSGALFSSIPAPKSSPVFSAIPPPKSAASSGNPKPKRVVQFRPPPIRQPTGESSDEEDDAEKRRSSASEAPPSIPVGSGPVSSFLPPPKHSLGLGSGARRTAIDTAAPERSNLGAAAPSSSAVNTIAPEKSNSSSSDADESEESGGEEDMPVPEEQYEQPDQNAFDIGVGQQKQQGYAAGVGSTNGYEGNAWDPNYYANYSANYGWDSTGAVSYGTGAQYAAHGGDQGGGYGNTYGEHSGGYEHSAAVPYGGDYAGLHGHEVATMTAPPMDEPVLPPEMGRVGGKRGRNDTPTEILEVNQAELMKNRPREDKSKLTGLAFGPSYQPASSGKGKPSKLHKRKHQIGSLFYDMKQKEMELAERRSKGFLTKAETQAKYGW